jgi:hypothetical protein
MVRVTCAPRARPLFDISIQKVRSQRELRSRSVWRLLDQKTFSESPKVLPRKGPCQAKSTRQKPRKKSHAKRRGSRLLDLLNGAPPARVQKSKIPPHGGRPKAADLPIRRDADDSTYVREKAVVVVGLCPKIIAKPRAAGQLRLSSC